MVWEKWCKTLLLCFIVLLLAICGIGEFLLVCLHEDTLPQDVAEMSLKEPVLYGSAISDDVSSYKLPIVAAKKPSVLAFGSSRVMQMRAAFFKNEDFYTLGGTVGNVSQLRGTYEKVRDVYKPQIAIIGIDLWWVNPKYSENAFSASEAQDRSHLRQRIWAYGRVFSEILKNKDLRGMVFAPGNFRERDVLGGRRACGARAAVYSEGYREDGSHQYGKLHLNPVKWQGDINKVWKRIVQGTDKFQGSDHLDGGQMENLQSVLHEMRADGVEVVAFLAPFPHATIKQFMSNEGQKNMLELFREKVPIICSKENIPCYDFSDMADVESPDEESIDWFHGGERTYARLLLKLYEEEGILKPCIDVEHIRDGLEMQSSPYMALDPRE